MRCIRQFILLVSTQVICLGFAVASDKVVEKPVTADTPEKFAEVAAAVRKDMLAGGRYEFISASDKAKAEIDLDSIAAMLQKSGSVASMQQDEKVKLFNAQEHLNGILTHSDRNRLVCERRPPMGTNIPVTTCKTVAQIETARRDAQKMMLDHSADAFKAGQDATGRKSQ